MPTVCWKSYILWPESTRHFAWTRLTSLFQVMNHILCWRSFLSCTNLNVLPKKSDGFPYSLYSSTTFLEWIYGEFSDFAGQTSALQGFLPASQSPIAAPRRHSSLSATLRWSYATPGSGTRCFWFQTGPPFLNGRKNGWCIVCVYIYHVLCIYLYMCVKYIYICMCAIHIYIYLYLHKHRLK